MSVATGEPYFMMVIDILTALNSIVSILSILRNPMILLGLVSMVIFLGMPKLVENSTCASSFPPLQVIAANSTLSGPRNAR